MAITPTGILSEPLDHGQTLLANSSHWQSWLGVSTAADAKKSIYLGASPPPANGEAYTQQELSDLWPLAIVDVPPDGAGLQVSRAGDGTELVWPHRGRLVMAFEDAVDENLLDQPGEARLAFLNDVGQVIEDMLALAGTDDGTNQYLWLRQVNILDGPVREDFNEHASVGAYQWLVLELPWGFSG